MATMSGEANIVDESSVHSAVCRVEAYLRSLGVTSGSIAGECAQRIVAEVQYDQPNLSPNDLSAKAMELAIRTVGLWLDEIADSVECHDRNTMRTQLAWYVRTVVSNRPEILFRRERFIDTLGANVKKADRPIVPEACPIKMEPQHLGQLPSLWTRCSYFTVCTWFTMKRLLTGRV